MKEHSKEVNRGDAKSMYIVNKKKICQKVSFLILLPLHVCKTHLRMQSQFKNYIFPVVSAYIHN